MINQTYKWIKTNIFPTPFQAIVSLFLIFFLYIVLGKLLSWAVFNAVWSAESGQVCRELSQGNGACWAFIKEKILFIMFGFYPAEERWRAWIALALFFVGIAYSGRRSNWKVSLVFIWFLILFTMMVLLNGYLLGLKVVPTNLWGGLIVTIVLAMNGIIFSYPFGILLALGRTNKRLPFVRGLCVTFIELIRGVPFISLLFMASLMLPLFLPASMDFPKFTRAIVATILFAGAYTAETVRGGIASIPRGQYEAAEALGLGYWRITGSIILPQALTKIIQPTVGSFISLFIDTSLVVIISMYDLLGAARAVMSDPNWLGFSREVYLFLALVYFGFCYTMSKYSRSFETQLFSKRTF